MDHRTLRNVQTGVTAVLSHAVLNESCMDQACRAVGWAAEEAVMDSMLHAESVAGRAGHTRKSLREFL